MIKSRIVYGTLLVCSLFLYLFFSDYIAFIGIVIIAAILPLLAVINLTSALRLRVWLKPSSDTTDTCGNVIHLALRTENRLAVPISHMRVELKVCNSFAPAEVFYQSLVVPLASGSEESIPVHIASEYCGEVTVSVSKVKIYDMLGITVFTRRYKKQSNSSVALVILPDYHEITVPFTHIAAPDPDGDRFSTIKSGDDSSQVFGYHEYQPGDRMKNINWKLSTKLDTVMVKELSLPLGSSVCLLPLLCSAKGEAESLPLITDILSTLTSVHYWLMLHETAHDLCIAEKESFDLVTIENSDDFYIGLHSIYKQSPTQLSVIVEQLAQEKQRYSRCYCVLSQNDIEIHLKCLETLRGGCSSLFLLFVSDGVSTVTDDYKRVLEELHIEWISVNPENLDDVWSAI